MSYQNNDPKPLPSIEYSLKTISWHLKVISENLAKLVQPSNSAPEQFQTPPSFNDRRNAPF